MTGLPDGLAEREAPPDREPPAYEPMGSRGPLRDFEERSERRRGLGAARRRRRALAFDVLAAAAIAGILLAALPGLGVVAWFCLPIFLLVLLTVAGDRLIASRRRRRHGQAPRASRRRRRAGSISG